MKLKDLVLGLIVLLIIYLVYIWFFTDSTKAYLISSVKDAIAQTIPASDLPKPLTNDFTYSFWIYINSWETHTDKKKVIIQRGNGTTNKGIKIYLTEYVNNLKIDIPMIQPTSPGTYESTDDKNCQIKNIPLQRWVCITISVNNRSSDLYLDGKLVNTCVYSGVITDNVGTTTLPIDICTASGSDVGGYNGSISNVLYYARAINPREAYSIYRQGPGGGNTLINILNKYGLKFSFMSHGKEIHNIQI